jgi:hypothetical protein
MKHRHRWNMHGIISDGHLIGMAHRICAEPTCRAELYEPASAAEFRKHDDGSVRAQMKAKGIR